MKRKNTNNSGLHYQMNLALKNVTLWGGLLVFALSLSFVVFRSSEEFFKASIFLTPNSYSDPLRSSTQCTDTNEVQLRIKGGSPEKIWEFIGAGIDGKYGTLIDPSNTDQNTNSITTVGQKLMSDELSVTYRAPKSSEIQQLGASPIQVKVTDPKLSTLGTGESQSVIFSLHITPSCVKSLRFIYPDPNSIVIAQKGIAFPLDIIEAQLHNGDLFRYSLPYDDIQFAVTPESAGTFVGNIFYTTLTSGKAFLYAAISQGSNATMSSSVHTDPLLVDIGPQQCELKSTIYEGKGEGLQYYESDLQPAPLERHLRSGETWAINVDKGIQSYLWTSTNTQVLTVEPLIPPTSPSADSTTPATNSNGILLTDFAKITAVGPGVATVTVTDRLGCTALLTVYVDIFPAKIRYARLEGTGGISKGTHRNLYVEVENKGGIDQIANLQVILVKGYIKGPQEISNKEIYDVINVREPISKEDTPTTEDTSASTTPVDPALTSYTRLYKIPIYIPEVPGIVDGSYSLLIIVTDKNATSSGIFYTYTVLPIRIGAGVSGDLNNDNKVDISDVVLMFRYISQKEQASQQFSLQDLITLLRQILQ